MSVVSNEQLLDAATAGDVSVLKEWKKQNDGVDINEVKTSSGWTPLLYACFNGHSECVEYLIESAKADVHCRDGYGHTPLYWACRNGHSECVEYLIESAKADVNCKNNDGHTPLHEACCNGHSECVEHLISARADVNCKNKNNKTPFQMINVQGQVKMIKSTISRLSHLRSQLQLHKQSATSTAAALSKHNNPQVRTTINISIDQDRRGAVHTEALADVTFLCGQGNDQQPIKANSGVLMITVPSIQALIDSGIQHQDDDDSADAVTDPTHKLVPLPNLQSKHVQHVLKCIYAGEISFDDITHDSGTDQPTHTLTGQDDLQQLILVANEFDFWRLKFVLEVEMARKHLTADTMIDVLLFADQHKCALLKDAAMRAVAENTQTVFTHPDFSKLAEHPQLMIGIHARCSGGTKNDGIDDEYSGMSMMELYSVVDEDEGSLQVDSYMDRSTLLDFVRSIKSSSATETNGATEKEE